MNHEIFEKIANRYESSLFKGILDDFRRKSGDILRLSDASKPAPRLEILLEEEGNIKVARVLTRHDLPLCSYPHFGTWAYLLSAGDELVVLDCGPKYSGLNMHRPTKRQPAGNAKLIMEVLTELWPNKAIREILLSHYHYDHTEAAPALQSLAWERFGFRPPIRIHEADSGDKIFLHVMKQSLEKQFRLAGYDDWLLGDNIQDGEQIEGTDFMVKLMPGHTSGTIGLINAKQKIAICGYKDCRTSRMIDLALSPVHEDVKSMRQAHAFLEEDDYTCYIFHPMVVRKDG
ncbi:MAG TPA: MBL fold metallo-hydrolase [Candidatus Wirthbacteria bacterium]|nr:MBL fold metallo-hydrolase [Candidatus Wirthbacteria bacterium]